MELLKEFKGLTINSPSDRASEEFELDYQENLPAYLDDVEKIIKCSSNCSIVDYEINSGCINLYGKTIISITYLSSQGFLLSNVFEEDFTKAVDIAKKDNICFADVRLKTKYSSSRLINQRRIDVHISLNAVINCFEKNSLNVMSNCKNAFVREYKTQILQNRYISVSLTDFDETFSVSGDSQIKNITNVFTQSSIEEYKLIKEKMLVKIKTQVSVLYKSDDENIQRFQYSFITSKIADVPNCQEEDKVLLEADISSLYVKTKTDSDNKINEIELVGRIAVRYKIFSIEEEEFITDSYLPKYNANLSFENAMIQVNPVEISQDTVTRLEIQSETPIAEVLDMNAVVIDSEIVDSVLKFSAKVSLLYFDSDSDIRYTEKLVSQELRLSDTSQKGVCSVNLISADYVINNSDTISVKLNFSYTAFIFDEKSLDFVSDIEENGIKDMSNSSPLTLYFADKGENIWDIAKEFSADLIKLSEDNKLTGDVINEKKILLISEM